MPNTTKKNKTVTNEVGPASKPFSLHPLSTEEALRVLLRAKPVRKQNVQSKQKKQANIQTDKWKAD